MATSQLATIQALPHCRALRVSPEGLQSTSAFYVTNPAETAKLKPYECFGLTYRCARRGAIKMTSNLSAP